MFTGVCGPAPTRVECVMVSAGRLPLVWSVYWCLRAGSHSCGVFDGVCGPALTRVECLMVSAGGLSLAWSV